jgi:S1-C subfamily serine protease
MNGFRATCTAVILLTVSLIFGGVIVNQIVNLPSPQIIVRPSPQIIARLDSINRRINADENVMMRLLTAVPYPRLQELTVRVDIGHGCGTGVLVTRQVGDVRRTFVWTAGHVVQSLRREDGTFSNPIIYQEWRENGKFKCSTRVEAKVIAYSDPDAGDDLALLEVLQDNFAPADVSATFVTDTLSVGTPLVHVGCTLGLYDSTSQGIVSQTDRDLLHTGKMFDQTSCIGSPGSSGGGVYLRDGRCIGLLVRGCGAGLNFVVPARRMVEWAKKMHVEWAVNPAVPVPMHWNMREPCQLTDGTESAITGPCSVVIEAIRKIIAAIRS